MAIQRKLVTQENINSKFSYLGFERSLSESCTILNQPNILRYLTKEHNIEIEDALQIVNTKRNMNDKLNQEYEDISVHSESPSDRVGLSGRFVVDEYQPKNFD